MHRRFDNLLTMPGIDHDDTDWCDCAGSHTNHFSLNERMLCRGKKKKIPDHLFFRFACHPYD